MVFSFQDWYEAEGWEDFRRGKEYVQYQDFPFDMVRPKKRSNFFSHTKFVLKKTIKLKEVYEEETLYAEYKSVMDIAVRAAARQITGETPFHLSTEVRFMQMQKRTIKLIDIISGLQGHCLRR